MRKTVFMVAVVLGASTACKGDFEECPAGPYNTHNWVTEIYGSDHYVEKCRYCDRHRRVYHDDKMPYVYEDMSTGNLSIEVPRSAIKK